MGPYPELPLIETSPATSHRWLLAGFGVVILTLAAVGVAIVSAGSGGGQAVDNEPAASVGFAGDAGWEPQEPGPVPTLADGDDRWEAWVVEPITIPARGPLDDEGRHLYIEIDEGSVLLSILPETEIRSPRVDARIDGYPVTIVRIPGSSAALHILAIGQGTVRLHTVDVDEPRAHEVLTAALRSLGDRLDGDLLLPSDATVVSDRTASAHPPAGEAWTVQTPAGEVVQIGRVRLDSPERGRELEMQVRVMGAQVVVDDVVVVWFLPQMDDPTTGAISWEVDGSRWSVAGVSPDHDTITELLEAAPIVTAER